ncbi:MAG: hypothetical protein V7642_438 [Burkholderiales bacterium]|jgi:hypothetical protein
MTMMHIDFPILFAESFFWAMLLGAAGTRRWLAAGSTVIIVSCIHLGQIGTDLFLVGSNEAYGWLAFLSIGVLVPSCILASIGCSIGGFVGRWIVSLFQQDKEIVDEGQDL